MQGSAFVPLLITSETNDLLPGIQQVGVALGSADAYSAVRGQPADTTVAR